MKLIKSIVIFLTCTTIVFSAKGQADPYLDVAPQNSGVIGQGGSGLVNVIITNPGPVDDISQGVIFVQFSVPTFATIAATGHVLPSGWTIVPGSITATSIAICNSGGPLLAFDVATLSINVEGTSVGGPSNTSGTFSAKINCDPSSTGDIPGDNSGNNSNTGSIQVMIVAPVTLTDFNSTLVNCQPVLHWATETEINSDRFEIERGRLNNADWTTIGTVASHGNSTQRLEYNFTDRDLSGSPEKVLYRLKMIDIDGSHKYSEVLRVSVNCKVKQVDVYPSPVRQGKLYVSLTGVEGYAEATLLSLSGQLISRKQMTNGTNYLTVSNIPGGIYILNVKDANGIDERVKVVIQN